MIDNRKPLPRFDWKKNPELLRAAIAMAVRGLIDAKWIR